MSGIRLKAFWIVLGFLTACPSAWGASGRKIPDVTMLMFVGEELSVVTVASRIPETPAAAPAIARVIDHSEIQARGFQTLAELLATEPGFYMANEARGSVPFLRGIPNGVLFLYDGVPITSDVTKNFHPLDRELSLHNVKRVEIVRGPASVLWGPDAFAGIVNVVPFSGKDRPGFETKAFGGSNDLRGAYTSYGGSGKNWDAFISGYGAKDLYHDPTFSVERPVGSPADEPIGEGRIGDSRYAELTGNAHVGDWLSISGRLSDFNSRYTLNDISPLSWEGQRESPVNFIKTTATKTIGASHLSLTGYYQNVQYAITNVDLRRQQENNTYYGEFLWDRRVMEKGLLTAGASMRTNQVKEATVEEGFLPGFLVPDNISRFGTSVTQADFTNRLQSVFTQYRHQVWGIDWWLGLRMDQHSQYSDTLSYSLGLNWPVADDWRIKAAYGTAYRSVFAPQLFGGTDFDPEGVNTVNFQVSWTPTRKTTLDATLFHSRLSDIVSEDPYGVLSAPSDERIYGVEFAGRIRLREDLELFGSLTALESQGEPDRFSRIRFFSLRLQPDGTFIAVPGEIDIWEEGFDIGPHVIGNLGCIWRFHPRASLAFNARNTSKVPFTFSEDTVAGEFYSPILLDLTLKVQDILLKDTTFTLRGTNLLDQDYQIPGFYGPVEGEGFAAYAEIAYRF